MSGPLEGGESDVLRYSDVSSSKLGRDILEIDFWSLRNSVENNELEEVEDDNIKKFIQ